jgi:hypothetical protein
MLLCLLTKLLRADALLCQHPCHYRRQLWHSSCTSPLAHQLESLGLTSLDIDDENVGAEFDNVGFEAVIQAISNLAQLKRLCLDAVSMKQRRQYHGIDSFLQAIA